MGAFPCQEWGSGLLRVLSKPELVSRASVTLIWVLHLQKPLIPVHAAQSASLG